METNKTIEDKVYDGGVNLDFLADQVAGIDSMQTFLIDCIRTSENFKHLQEKLTNGLTAVSITKSINVDDYINSHVTGYVVRVKRPNDSSLENTPDYFRDDEGIPIIFETLEEIPGKVGNMTIVRVIDLAEEAARRADV